MSGMASARGLLTEQAAASSEKYHQASERLKTIEKHTTEITNLQRHIGAYIKTRDVYRQYREAGYNKKFYAAHESDILIHQSAKRAFDELGLKKLPAINALRQEYATLDVERKTLYPLYRLAREEMQTLLVAKNNVDRLLNMAPPSQTHRLRSEPEL